MKANKSIHSLIYLLLISAFLLACTGTHSAAGGPESSVPTREEGHEPIELRLGMYPYVPRLQQFEAVLRAKWIRPDVSVTMVAWDGGYKQDPEQIDVFVFDGIFLDYFVQQGYLAEISLSEITNVDDILDYARQGSQIAGKYYAIPQIGCAPILFYRARDEGVASVSGLQSLAQELGQCQITGEKPPAGKGLMIDLSGGTTSATYYLDAVMDVQKKYNPEPLLPTPENLDASALQNLHTVVSMAGVKSASYEPDPWVAYQRAIWFGDGIGRAMVGFTESLAAMGVMKNNVEFKLLPLSEQPEVALFYTDMIGINAKIKDIARRRAALELANFLASDEYLVAAFGPNGRGDGPQYLMPVRHSIFDKLAQNDALYAKMRKLVHSARPHPFRIGPESRQWLQMYKQDIQQQIVSPDICSPSTASP